MPAIPSGLTITERTKVHQLLAMTASDNDGEVLNAIRAVNRILKAKEVHWLDFLGAGAPNGPSTDPASARPEPPKKPAQKTRTVADEIDEAFEDILETATGTYRDTITSIHEQWELTGSLSERQREVVINGAERARRWGAAGNRGGRF